MKNLTHPTAIVKLKNISKLNSTYSWEATIKFSKGIVNVKRMINQSEGYYEKVGEASAMGRTPIEAMTNLLSMESVRIYLSEILVKD